MSSMHIIPSLGLVEPRHFILKWIVNINRNENLSSFLHTLLQLQLILKKININCLLKYTQVIFENRKLELEKKWILCPIEQELIGLLGISITNLLTVLITYGTRLRG